jgi:molecular chaperone GrpE
MTEIPITFDGQPGSQGSAAGAPTGPGTPGSAAPANAGEQCSPGGAGSSPGVTGGGSAAGGGAAGNGAGAAGAGAGAPEAAAHAPATPDANQDTEAEAVEIEEDLSELVKKAKQRDEYLAIAQRTQADFENYRRRVAKDAAKSLQRGAVSLAKELLPALDNLDRALEAAAQDDPLLEGVRLVRADIAAALARSGIESFSPQGEQFDPALHEAVATAPAPDGQAGGTVVEVYQAGYRCGDDVIRPARVVVAA